MWRGVALCGGGGGGDDARVRARVCVRVCVCVQHTGITASGRAVVAQVLTLIFTRLYTFTPRVIKFGIHFI